METDLEIKDIGTGNTSEARLLSDPNVVELLGLMKDIVAPKQLPNVTINVNHQIQLLPTKAKKSNNIQKKRKKRSKNKGLTRKEYADLGLYTLPTNSMKYNDLLPLHHLWTQYIREFLHLHSKTKLIDVKDTSYEKFGNLLNKIDFHGAHLTVSRSKCPSLVGVNGIVVMDTKNTFKICGKDNKLRTIPKEDSVFQMTVDTFQFTMFGKHLTIRPAERSVKKIKNFMVLDL